MPVGSKELSFERMFALRAVILGAYIVGFYVLTDFAKVPALPALCLVVAVTAWSAFISSRWISHEPWFDNILAVVFLGTMFCGAMPLELTSDRRDMRAPWWATGLFLFCGSETIFFLSALGVFGAKLADPVSAIAASVIMLVVQVVILAIGFQFFSKPPAVKNRWDD